MEQAERDAEDLRKLDEQAQERARQAEQERDEVKRLLEAAQRELAAQQGAAHALSLRLEKAERERAVFVEAIDKVKEIVRATCGPAAARPSVWSERRKNGEPIAAVYDIGLVTDRAAALIEKGDPDPRQGRPGAGADLLDSDGQETFRKDRTSVSSIAVPPPPPAAPPSPAPLGNWDCSACGLRGIISAADRCWSCGRTRSSVGVQVQRCALPRCTCATGTCAMHDAVFKDPAPAADHEPPPGASPPEIVRAPNLRRHRRRAADMPCTDCGASAAEIAAGKPCPGKKAP
jgi:hypothetical protein